mgnify:CR=1 FL=1
MQMRWLLVLGCLLITACSNPGDETSQTPSSTPAQVASKTESPEATPAPDEKKAETPKEEAKPEPKQEEAKPEPKQEEAKPEVTEATPAEQIKTIIADYTKASRSLMTEARKMPGNEGRDYYYANLPKLQKQCGADLNAVVAANADNPANFDAIMWITMNMAGSEAGTKAMDTLFEKYIDNEKMVNLCTVLAQGRMPVKNADAKLEQLIEESPHKAVRASATMALAKNVKDETRAEELYESLIANYGDLTSPMTRGKTFKEAADNALFQLKYLSIGKIAPDIEGEDLDGVAFKLSDYRGKVVVLDFWGDW